MNKKMAGLAAVAALLLSLAPQPGQATEHCHVGVFSGPAGGPTVNLGAAGQGRCSAPAGTNVITPGAEVATAFVLASRVCGTPSTLTGSIAFFDGNSLIRNDSKTFALNTGGTRYDAPLSSIPANTTRVRARATYDSQLNDCSGSAQLTTWYTRVV